MSAVTLKTFGERLKWARSELRLKVKEAIIPIMTDAGHRVSVNRWYDWEKIGTYNDSRRRRMRQKENSNGKRVSAYHPPWPDELVTIESQLGVRTQWLLTGKGNPFVEDQKQRATDTDPVFAALAKLYSTTTDEQKRAIYNLVKSFKPNTDQHDT